MKHVFALLSFALMSSASAQTVLPPNYSYNPDSDGDEFVAVSDVLMSVASYDSEFQAQPIMVDTLSLEEAIQMLLQQQILNQQALIQSQQDLIDGLTNSLTGVEGFEPCLLNWTCGCPLTYQGYDYATVQIGEQCWFAENLRAEAYSNGDPVALLGPSDCCADWEGQAVARVNPIEAYGNHYTWEAIMDERGVCPTNWRLSSDEDWYTMEATLGLLSGESCCDWGWRGDYGTDLKSTNMWNGDGNGTDAVGFGGLPAGNYGNEGSFGFWWAPLTSPEVQRVSRWLGFDQDGVKRSTDANYQLFSVRCIQDSE